MGDLAHGGCELGQSGGGDLPHVLDGRRRWISDEQVAVVALHAPAVSDDGRLPVLEHLPRHGLDSGQPQNRTLGRRLGAQAWG